MIKACIFAKYKQHRRVTRNSVGYLVKERGKLSNRKVSLTKNSKNVIMAVGKILVIVEKIHPTTVIRGNSCELHHSVPDSLISLTWRVLARIKGC